MPEMTIQQAFDLALQHHQAGRLSEAEPLYRQILAVEPRHADSLQCLGLIAHQVGRNDVAADLINQAITAVGAVVPTSYLGNLAWVQVQLGEAYEAERLIRDALHREPESSTFHNTLGNALYLQGRISEAAASWKEAFDHDGTSAHALGNWANVLQETGKIREAMAAHQQAAAIDPEPHAAWGNYLRDVGFLPDLDPTFVREEHEKWAETFLATIDPSLIRGNHANPRDPARKLNVGLVSADFRLHSVAYFIEPLLRHLSRENFSLFCYSNVHAPDETTARLQGYPAVWRNIVGQSDVQAAEQMVRDGIDILIDLGGHTSKSRCRILTYKPAPVQITYLGYPHTTGLKSCDYRLTDEVSDPAGLTDSHYTEKLLRLPVSSWCFQPPQSDVPVSPPPLEKHGRVTFGSFNTYNKINDAVLDAWGRIMARVPSARLFVKSHGLADPQIRAELLARLRARGVEEERVVIMGREPQTDQHLALYADVDIALDTFPYNGTTTTCEALWQGVPVVGIEGRMHVARVGQTLHQAVGLENLTSKDADGYVELAVRLAADPDRLRDLRRTMRERMLKSPLCDQPAFARHFEQALRSGWREWCATVILTEPFQQKSPKNLQQMTNTTTLTMIDGVRIVVPDSLNLITPYVLLEQQDWFEDEIKFLRRLLQPGQKVIDIGANYGCYTLSMAKSVGSAGRVWAFEPASGTAALLDESINSNQFTQVILEQSALSSTCGTAQLALNDNSELNSLLHGGLGSTASEAVPMVTLDSCMERYEWSDIDFMKIDAEGEEANIIAGGKRFFEVLSPLVQYEIKVEETLNMLLLQDFASLGYDSYRLVPGLDLLVPFDAGSTPDGYLLNLFCCKKDRAERLAASGFLQRSFAEDANGEQDIPVSSQGKVRMPDGYGWQHDLAKLPYGLQLAQAWESTMAVGNNAELDEALAAYAMSRDPALTPSGRLRALEASFRLLTNLCARQPSHLRLSSLARVARDYGARTVVVHALNQLANAILQQNRADTDEPFLSVSERFDSIAPADSQIGNWVLAGVLEELERACAFSSFYTGASALQRLEFVQSLGFASEEMQRRLRLVRERFGTSFTWSLG